MSRKQTGQTNLHTKTITRGEFKISTVFQGTTSFPRVNPTGPNDTAVQARWWRTTGNNISIRSAVVMRNNVPYGTPVANWNVPTAVNGGFFSTSPTNRRHGTVGSFAINNGAPVLSSGGITNGSRNYEDIYGLRSPLDFMMDSTNRTRDGLIVFGNGGGANATITNSLNGNQIQIRDIRWGIGGFDLRMTEADNVFNNNFRWRHTHAGSLTLRTARTAIGYTGGNATTTNYIVATFSDCQIADVRSFFRSRGVTTFGLLLDGGGSTQSRNNNTVQDRGDGRNIPTIVAMS